MPTYNGSLPMMLYRSLEAVIPIYRDVFSKYQLTEQQWRVLRVLWENERIASNELASETLLSPNSLAGIVDRLETRSLVKRQHSELDRRVIYVLPTEQGLSLEEQMTPKVDAIHDSIRGTVSDHEWQQLDTILNKIRDGLA